MRFDTPPRLAAGSVWLPPAAESAEQAVARGAIDADVAADLGYRALPTATGRAAESAPDMAVQAASDALKTAGWNAADLDLVVYAWSHYQGHDFWSPPHYVADRLGAPAANPLGVQQMCNGGAAALQIAAVHLLAGTGVHRSLVATGDRFAAPGFRRWDGDYGVAYGDGATAVLVTDEDVPGLDLLALHTVAAPHLEGMHRGNDAFAPAPRWARSTVDVRRTKKAYLRAHGSEGFRRDEVQAVRQVVSACLEAVAETAGAAGAKGARGAKRAARAADPVTVILPRLGRVALEDVYLPAIAELTEAETVDPGSATGHLGAGDLLAGLADLLADQGLESGESALVLSAGAGFTWSCAAVRAG